MHKSTTYIPHGVTLSQNQRLKLAKALEKRPLQGITIRLSHSELTGPDELMLTKTQIGRIGKALSSGKGVDIKISKTQIGKVVKKGGSLFSSLAALVPTLLPKAMQVASKVVPGLAMGALGSLGNFTMDKILGQGIAQQVGGFLIPQDKVDKLIANKKYLTKKQKEDILNALQTGGQTPVIIKPTPRQRGGFLGTLLASIGVPLLLNALSGKGLSSVGNGLSSVGNGLSSVGNGLQNRQACSKGHGLQNRPSAYPTGYAPFPPPFIGQWGDGSKKTSGKGILFGKNSPFNGIPLLGAIL